MVEDWKEIIREETEKCKVTTLGEEGKSYSYAILPLESVASQHYLSAVTTGLTSMLRDEIGMVNAIVGIEAKGFIPAVLVAQQSGKRFISIRKRDYKTPDQLIFKHETAYGKEELLYSVGLKKGDRVLIVEDMISGGGTGISVVNGSVKGPKEYEVVGMGTLYDRGNGRKTIEKETGISSKSLATIDIVNGKPKVVSFYPENNLSD